MRGRGRGVGDEGANGQEPKLAGIMLFGRRARWKREEGFSIRHFRYEGEATVEISETRVKI